MSKVERICANPYCAKPFLARQADVARGWAKCCSKACAAWKREKKLDRNGYRSPPKQLVWPDDFVGKPKTLLERLQFHEMSMGHLADDHDCNKEPKP